MSGKPSASGVAETIVMLDKLASLDREIHEIERQLPRLGAARDERKAVFQMLANHVGAMDVSASGNYGWDDRMIWFLGQLLRQARSGE